MNKFPWNNRIHVDGKQARSRMALIMYVIAAVLGCGAFCGGILYAAYLAGWL
jgi:Tfp pilus assembly protein PilN